MKNLTLKLTKQLLFLGIISLFLGSCGSSQPKIEISGLGLDLKEIKERGKLIALTGYNSTSYFVYKGTPMGYEYELLEQLAMELEVDLEVKVVQRMDQILDLLNQGVGDIVAINMTVTQERQKEVNFTDHITLTRQVLVQRTPESFLQTGVGSEKTVNIKSTIDLIGKKVFVRTNTSYSSRLKNLSDEIGGEIKINEVEGDVNTEDLIKKVAEGEIDYTVADENVALINQTYYSNLNISVPISFPQKIAWAVRKDSPDLTNAVNSWLKQIKKKNLFYVLYAKYYRNQKLKLKTINSEFFSPNTGKISPYDKTIKKYAKKIDWDWRIIASLIYQESKFDPCAESWTGAKGLMQLMPTTAEQFGTYHLEDPTESIIIGTKYLAYLDRMWDGIVPNKEERIKFILASYNVGQGHVFDARRLAEKYGKDPNIWEGNVDFYLLNKSKEKYFNDPVVKVGYCRGEEPFNYVREILSRFNHYKNFVPKSGNKNSKNPKKGILTNIIP
ncbi:MAG: membrane-bound lytic murein transglycosylase F [Sphingobacteriales bacterium]|jgi:membrane-bound lytic murein transglycosylase F